MRRKRKRLGLGRFVEVQKVYDAQFLSNKWTGVEVEVEVEYARSEVEQRTSSQTTL